MRTTKDVIYDALLKVGLPVSYIDTDKDTLPRINFFLVSNWHTRRSNKRHTQRLVYQVDVYSNRPLDVEFDPVLWQIITELEDENLLTSDWREVLNVNEKENRSVYHYWLEVK